MRCNVPAISMTKEPFEDKSTRVLLIRFSSIGDIILTTPLIEAIKEKHPDIIIDYLTLSEYAGLLKYNPNIDNLIIIDRKKGLKESIGKALELRRKNYRYIFDLHRSTRSMVFRVFMYDKKRFILNKRYIKRFLLTTSGINFYRKPFSVVNRYFDVAEALNVSAGGRAGIWISPEELSAVVAKIKMIINIDINNNNREKVNLRIDKGVIQNQGRRIISLMPFAKWKTKEWGDDKFIELGKKISGDADADILVLGGAEDAVRAEGVASGIGARAKSAAGKFSLLETVAALSVSDALVTNDTGVMHMAGAVSVPAVSIFGSTSEELGFFPYNTEGAVIQKNLKCRPCTAKGLNRCPKKHFACMNDISVEEVYNTVKRYI